jgi:two-component system sensor histidine kinase MprB
VNLRARLALWLGALAGAAALAVALTGYQATSGRLGAELDTTLTSYGQRLEGPDASLASALCASTTDVRNRFRGPRRNPLLNLPGATVQCLGPDGAVIARAAATVLPVSEADRQAAAGGADASFLRTAHLDGVGDVRMITVPVNGGAVQLARSTSENDRVLDALRARYALLVVAVTAVAAAAGWAIARRTTQPVLALTDVTERIAAEGRLDLDVPTSGTDEVGRLARSFSGMLDALRRSRSQQQRLVEDAGHELRTPLTSLRTNVDTLRRHPELDGARREELLDDLDSELRELTGLTDELVGLAADSSVEEPVQGVDLAAIATRSAARLRRRTGREVLVDTTAAPLVGQPRQLARMVDNLLENAAKFSPAGTPIELAVHPGILAVRDHGPGFVPADLPHVFERFYRADTARSTPGSGLGLSIVADIAARHGATATATNLPDGGAGLIVRFAAPA